MSMSEEGLVTIPSGFSVKETIDRLEREAKSHGLTIFARVDHAGGAAQVGMALRPTELLIFGNARGGTALMQDHQTAGLDLPLKALAWEDAEHTVWLTHNTTAWIVKRHGLGETSAAAVAAIEATLARLSKAATAP
jgi:uncharacterized protein (DUF302 family)